MKLVLVDENASVPVPEMEMKTVIKKSLDKESIVIYAGGNNGKRWVLATLRVKDGKLILERHGSISDEYIKTDDRGRIEG